METTCKWANFWFHRPLPPPGYASEGIILSPFTSTGSYHSPLHLRDRGPSQLNPWQQESSTSHVSVVTAHTYTSTQLERERERDRKRKRPIVETESQMLGSQNYCLPAPKSQWKPKTGPVVKTKSQVLNAKVSKQLPGPTRDVTRKSRDQRQTQRGDEKRKQPKSKKQEESGNTYDWDKGGRLSELRTRYNAKYYIVCWWYVPFPIKIPLQLYAISFTSTWGLNLVSVMLFVHVYSLVHVGIWPGNTSSCGDTGCSVECFPPLWESTVRGLWRRGCLLCGTRSGGRLGESGNWISGLIATTGEMWCIMCCHTCIEITYSWAKSCYTPHMCTCVCSYRLWQLVWRAWTEYMQLVKEKERKNDAARKLGEPNTL